MKAFAIGGTDSDAETGNPLGTEMDENGLEPVVSAGGSGPAEPENAKREGCIIQHDHDLFSLELEKPRIASDRLAAQIHERLGLHDRPSAAAGHLGVPLRIEGKRAG